MLAHKPTSHTHSPYRVLVVDDEITHRSMKKEVLANPDYRVYEAKNGKEALTILKNQEFDVILLDKRMPGMSGDQLCQAIRNELNMPLLPVIMVTGCTTFNDMASSMQSGASDFIRKPYQPMELVARVNAAASKKRLTDQLDSAESLLFALARMVEAKDECTGDHCSRLAHVSSVFGEALGLSDLELLALRRGGVLHDIGKLGIPDNILLKKGPLTEKEWIIMRQHTVIGAHLCSELKSMKETLPIIRNHHERWDGKGYPDGLKGKDIPVLARVFQIADIYDALTNERPYKKALPCEKAIHILEKECEDGWRDPKLTNIFLDILRDRPNDLVLPANREKDLGRMIFDDIIATGALDYDRGVS